MTAHPSEILRQCACCEQMWPSHFFSWYTLAGRYTDRCGVCAKTHKLLNKLWQADEAARPKRVQKPRRAWIPRPPAPVSGMCNLLSVWR